MEKSFCAKQCEEGDTTTNCQFPASTSVSLHTRWEDAEIICCVCERWCTYVCLYILSRQSVLQHFAVQQRVNSSGCNSIAKRRFHGSVASVVTGLWFLPSLCGLQTGRVDSYCNPRLEKMLWPDTHGTDEGHMLCAKLIHLSARVHIWALLVFEKCLNQLTVSLDQYQSPVLTRPLYMDIVWSLYRWPTNYSPVVRLGLKLYKWSKLQPSCTLTSLLVRT